MEDGQNVQWVTIHGMHVPLGVGERELPQGELGDKAREYIKSESYSKLGALFSEHRKEFGLKKKDDAYIKAYQVIRSSNANSDANKKDKDIEKQNKQSEKLNFEKKLEQLNEKNTMIGKLGKDTYVVEVDKVRVPMEKPNGQKIYALRTVYSVTKFTKGGSTAYTKTYNSGDFDKFLGSSGISSNGWTFKDSRLSNSEKDSLF